ncbi:hypothetical protein OC842_006654 [Tilletia horrida]|uniref:RRM domain-containing protein n=1 Tax=Tilletia horrida TaxID=155126 RepID=A0AAN6G7G9_9BASI|nr:hypothetical protein OC842_006654 [Tilletia horrida]
MATSEAASASASPPPAAAATTNGSASAGAIGTGTGTGTGAMPNPSLYINNINGKVKKEELRRQLYALFGTYGRILDVVATRANGMRRQAFVVFEDLAGATAAMRGLSGFVFYDEPLGGSTSNKKPDSHRSAQTSERLSLETA